MNSALEGEAGLNYVHSMAAVLGLPMDAERGQRVLAHLQRTAAMAELLRGAGLAMHDELAELFCPAPFPAEDSAGQLKHEPVSSLASSDIGGAA